MSAKWVPGDDDLDRVARTLAVPDREPDRIEQERTSLLAAAASLAQQRRHSRLPLIAGSFAAFAAAAAIVIFYAARPDHATTPKETISALGPAHYERISAWPDFVVRLDDGRIDIRVSKLAANERFRATTTDAEVEVRGTRFIVAADHGKLASVSVTEGRVEVRWAHDPPIFLAAGETWAPVHTAARDQVDLAPQPLAPAQDAPPVRLPPAKSAVPKTSSPKQHVSESSSATSTTAAEAKPSPPPSAPAPLVVAPRPGEAEFRAGVTSLRSGDANAATQSFATACVAAKNDALGEDACFWLGAAAKRAGQTSTARNALTQFIKAYPSSARVGEASALLGWLLYDAGELESAEKLFDVAAHDRVAKVKESAQHGLEAIKRKRSSR